MGISGRTASQVPRATAASWKERIGISLIPPGRALLTRLLGGLIFLAVFYTAYAFIPDDFYQARDDGIITMSHARNPYCANSEPGIIAQQAASRRSAFAHWPAHRGTRIL